MVVYVGLALVLAFGVSMRVVRMPHRGMVVLVCVVRAEVLEPTRHPVEVMSHVKMMVSVCQRLVLVVVPLSGRSVVSHMHSRSLSPAHDRQPLSYPIFPPV